MGCFLRRKIHQDVYCWYIDIMQWIESLYEQLEEAEKRDNKNALFSLFLVALQLPSSASRLLYPQEHYSEYYNAKDGTPLDRALYTHWLEEHKDAFIKYSDYEGADIFATVIYKMLRCGITHELQIVTSQNNEQYAILLDFTNRSVWSCEENVVVIGVVRFCSIMFGQILTDYHKIFFGKLAPVIQGYTPKHKEIVEKFYQPLTDWYENNLTDRQKALYNIYTKHFMDKNHSPKCENGYYKSKETSFSHYGEYEEFTTADNKLKLSQKAYEEMREIAKEAEELIAKNDVQELIKRLNETITHQCLIL